MITVTFALLTAFVLALVATGMLRRYAIGSNLLDMPNDRSSHTVATPRGGGAAIVVVVSVVLAVLSIKHVLPGEVLLCLLAGGMAIAVVGWIDDRRGLSPLVRLAIHLAAAALLLVPGTTSGSAYALGVSLGILEPLVLLLLIGWMVNLYNFMDGIDGLAGSEAVIVGAVGAGMLWWSNEPGWAFLSATIAMASAGFLVWNWPPARIFMGDVGSGYLGYLFGGIAVLTAVSTEITLWPWLILLGVFVVDATFTLLRRASRRARVFDAHRTHAYQQATRRLGGHRPVTLCAALINLIWLTPLAWSALLWPDLGALFLTVAWLPLIIVCVWLQAGQE